MFLICYQTATSVFAQMQTFMWVCSFTKHKITNKRKYCNALWGMSFTVKRHIWPHRRTKGHNIWIWPALVVPTEIAAAASPLIMAERWRCSSQTNRQSAAMSEQGGGTADSGAEFCCWTMAGWHGGADGHSESGRIRRSCQKKHLLLVRFPPPASLYLLQHLWLSKSQQLSFSGRNVFRIKKNVMCAASSGGHECVTCWNPYEQLSMAMNWLKKYWKSHLHLFKSRKLRPTRLIWAISQSGDGQHSINTDNNDAERRRWRNPLPLATDTERVLHYWCPLSRTWRPPLLSIIHWLSIEHLSAQIALKEGLKGRRSPLLPLIKHGWGQGGKHLLSQKKKREINSIGHWNTRVPANRWPGALVKYRGGVGGWAPLGSHKLTIGCQNLFAPAPAAC